jgi:hypothetical protein
MRQEMIFYSGLQLLVRSWIPAGAGIQWFGCMPYTRMKFALVHFLKTSTTSAFAWERRAPARLQKPRWSVAFPGECTSTSVEMHEEYPKFPRRGLIIVHMLELGRRTGEGADQGR